MKSSRICARWLGTLTLTASPLFGQRITGVVRDGLSHNPVPGAVIATQNALGTALAQTSADGAGRFAIPRASTVARVRVIRIGFTPTTVAVDGAARDTSLDVALEHLPPILAAVVVTDASLCPGTEPRGDAYDLWEQARAGLMSASVGRTDASVSAAVLSYERRRAASSDNIRDETQTIHRGAASKPFAALIDPTAVATRGFMAEGKSGRMFYGLDDEILLDDAFPATHCFHIDLADAAHGGQVGVVFEPAPGRDTIVEVRGVIWMDRAPLTLRSLEFSYTGLEPAAMRLGPGGHVDFATASNGVTFATDWMLRIPVVVTTVQTPGRYQLTEVLRRNRTDVRVSEVFEVGGEVLEATWSDQTRYATPVTAIAGTVTRAGHEPVARAALFVRGRADTLRTDTGGNFALSGLLPGKYQITAVDTALSHYVDSRRVETTLDVARGQTASVSMQLPPIDGASVAACGRAATQNGGIDVATRTNLFGRIAMPADSLKGPVRLEATWDLRDGESVRTRYADVDIGGNFRVCGLDRGAEVALRLTAGAMSADTAVHTMTPAITTFIWRPRLTQVIASTQRVVSGVVVDSGNTPIRGAQLAAHGRLLATTNDRGRFSFRVQAHDTTILDVRRIGYMAVRTPIMDGADTTIVVTMLPSVQILAGVDVSERRAATARLSGFEERLANWKHAATMQYFITAEDIAKRGAALITSVLGDVPGLTLATVSRGGQKVTVVLGHDRGRGGSCQPNIYVDGHRFDQMTDPEGIIGVIRPQDIAGIEVYPNITDAPVQYQALNGWCAIILIWSKGAK